MSVERETSHYVLKRVGPGEVLGEMALLTKEPRMATVKAISAGSAWALSATRFDELAARDPRISTFMAGCRSSTRRRTPVPAAGSH